MECFLKNSKKYIVGNLYIHPNEGVQWNEHFEDFMDIVLGNQTEMHLLGDFGDFN